VPPRPTPFERRFEAALKSEIISDFNAASKMRPWNLAATRRVTPPLPGPAVCIRVQVDPCSLVLAAPIDAWVGHGDSHDQSRERKRPGIFLRNRASHDACIILAAEW
jgi:hypothetical protein